VIHIGNPHYLYKDREPIQIGSRSNSAIRKRELSIVLKKALATSSGALRGQMVHAGGNPPEIDIGDRGDWQMISDLSWECVFCTDSASLLDGCKHEGVSKSARFAILNGRGEMAERLKAAVC
jgi:hypothetical protein